MKIRNRSVILIVRDGEMLRADAIAKKIAKPLAVLETLYKGGKLTKAHFEEAKIDLENLRDSLLFIKKAGV